MNTKPALFLTAGMDGEYAGMVKDHEQRHRAYCRKYDYEYAAHFERPTGNIDGWFRVDLVLRALRSGNYDYIFWIDADALVTDFSVDLRDALPSHGWLGMRAVSSGWAGECWHWQSGVFYVRCCDEALRYFESVRSLEMGSDQDSMINLLLDAPENQAGFVTLRAKWNVMPHFDHAGVRPVVLGFHGEPADPKKRRSAMLRYAEKFPYEEAVEPYRELSVGSPLDIANCCLWLDAHDLPVREVESWHDKSPKAAVYGSVERYKQERPTALQSVIFSEDYGLSSGTLPFTHGDFTLFFVVCPNKPCVLFNLGINCTAIPPACGFLIAVTNGGRCVLQRSGVGTGLIGQLPLGKFSLFTVVYKGGFVTSYINGAPSGGVMEVNHYFKAQEQCSIGSSSWPGPGEHHTKSGAMHVSEVIAYDRALEMYERAAIEKTLRESWEIES